ncbi:unnamed protein product, partial [Heterosigma akashiwo]
AQPPAPHPHRLQRPDRKQHEAQQRAQPHERHERAHHQRVGGRHAAAPREVGGGRRRRLVVRQQVLAEEAGVAGAADVELGGHQEQGAARLFLLPGRVPDRRHPGRGAGRVPKCLRRLPRGLQLLCEGGAGEVPQLLPGAQRQATQLLQVAVADVAVVVAVPAVLVALGVIADWVTDPIADVRPWAVPAKETVTLVKIGSGLVAVEIALPVPEITPPTAFIHTRNHIIVIVEWVPIEPAHFFHSALFSCGTNDGHDHKRDKTKEKQAH